MTNTLVLARWKLVVDGENFTIHNWTGRTRTLRIDEVTVKSVIGGSKVYKGEKKICDLIESFIGSRDFYLFYRTFHNQMESIQKREDFILSQGNNEATEREIFTVHPPRIHVVFGFFAAALWIAFIIFLSFIEIEGGSNTNNAFIDALINYGWMILIVFVMIGYSIMLLIWRIKVTSKRLVVRNFFGIEKSYPIDQITHTVERHATVGPNDELKEGIIRDFTTHSNLDDSNLSVIATLCRSFK